MTVSFDFLSTITVNHLSNPTGANLSMVAGGIACTPIDPLLTSRSLQDYPNEKLFSTKQTFTTYSGFAAGDYLEHESIRYVIKMVNEWGAGFCTPTFYRLVLEYTALDFEVSYPDKVLGYGPIAYWPLWEIEGEFAECLVRQPEQNGTYVGVTLGQTVTDDNGVSFVCPFFDGVNDYCNIGHAPFLAALNTAEGSMAVWCRVFDASVWTDSSVRKMLIFLTNANNRMFMQKTGDNNELRHEYRAGGVFDGQSTGDQSSTDWFHMAMTWSKSNDQLIYYIDGAPVGNIDTGLGVWAGAIVTALIGASSTGPVAPWHGWLAHAAIWDTPQAPSVIVDLAND